MIPGNNNPLLYEDLAHARPRPPIATPSIEVHLQYTYKITITIISGLLIGKRSGPAGEFQHRGFSTGSIVDSACIRH